MQRLAGTANTLYRRFTIPKKSGGKRIIEAPVNELRDAQREILYDVIYKHAPSKWCHGFRKARDIVTNAVPHVGAEIVLNIDLKDFFHQFDRTSVEKWFIGSAKVQPEIAGYYADIVTKDGLLPMGAPTSPALSNLLSTGLDFHITNFLKGRDIVYTRYADDLTFSSKTEKDTLPKIIPQIKRICKEHGVPVNEKKVHIMRRGRRMEVTGVVVNEKVNIPRTFYRETRAGVHNFAMRVKDEGGAWFDYAKFNNLKGRVAHIHHLNPQKAKALWGKLQTAEDHHKNPTIAATVEAVDEEE
jgi:retron-type reverse transcriptase